MDSAFEVHTFSELGEQKAKVISEAFDRLMTNLRNVCPDGHELALVKTKLEEACFFAKKAMGNIAENRVSSNGPNWFVQF